MADAKTEKRKVKEITDRLEEGLKELFESEKYKSYLSTMSKFHNYSFNNTLLIAMQKPEATLVAGYQAWQKNFNRHVNKGEKGISAMKSMLADYRERLTDVLMDYQKTANQIDSIGDELKQIGNSVSNVGRLLAGKGTKEVSDEKPGVGLTRIINKPVKKAVENLRKDIASVDKAFEKLDWLSERFDAGKEAETGGRASLKDKLSQMKAKADQQKKAPEPDKAKTQSKAECL